MAKNYNEEDSVKLIDTSGNPIETVDVADVTNDDTNKPVPVADLLPQNLTLLTVGHAVIFPGMIVPMILSHDRQKDLINYLTSATYGQSPDSGFLGVVIQHSGETKTVSKENLAPIGVVGRIFKKINLPDGSLSILFNGLRRFEIQKILQNKPPVVAQVEYLKDLLVKDVETEALARTVVNQFKQISQDNPLITEEMRLAMANVDGPGKLADLLSSILIRDNKTYQEFLGILNIKTRLEKLLGLLKKEIDVHNFQSKIQNQINENVSKSQREFFLNEQLKLIQKELGVSIDEKTSAVKKFRDRLEKIKPPKEALKRINDELEKLETLNENSSEFGVSYSYLDWLTTLPWGVSAQESTSLSGAKRQLNLDHFGLKDVKERILEFIAVRHLKKDAKGSIICFVGPPGVGKTSLGKSIAKALNRPFFRFSVGGMRDEAEIKGHRRTYVGAMPGKIIQGLKKAGADNPVFMIDEIDKMGSDLRGDPSSALLEALDPEQNSEFLDHYLDCQFDVSRALFICTANQLDTIPQPLLDRMEVIRISGYIEEEKLAIAEKYIIPKQLEKNGLRNRQLRISREALRKIIQGYARESGVRNLEKWIEKIARTTAMKIASKKATVLNVSPKNLVRYLGEPPFTDQSKPKMRPGISVGLAWTALGGETLTIEAVAVDGKGELKLTGQMGQVMNESANIAWTYVKNFADGPKFRKFFESKTIHLHIPAGAVPKDGPSAGITMAVCLLSLVTKRSMKAGIAMTGELTLNGQVLPVGGIKEKVLAAQRMGYRHVILPSENKRDLKSLPASVKKVMRFTLVQHMDEVIKACFSSLD
ncbi:MAG: endopeptidase La [Oligoflexia bacterium]|nr:endopeptidase La [Oligoflexia bacterium]